MILANCYICGALYDRDERDLFEKGSFEAAHIAWHRRLREKLDNPLIELPAPSASDEPVEDVIKAYEKGPHGFTWPTNGFWSDMRLLVVNAHYEDLTYHGDAADEPGWTVAAPTWTEFGRLCNEFALDHGYRGWIARKPGPADESGAAPCLPGCTGTPGHDGACTTTGADTAGLDHPDPLVRYEAAQSDQRNAERASAPDASDGSYCGCCGRPCDEGSEWCLDCINHVSRLTSPPWDRTYYAQHGAPCPFEEGNDFPYSDVRYWTVGEGRRAWERLKAENKRLREAADSAGDTP